MGASPQTSTIQNPDGSAITVAVSWTPAPPPPPPPAPMLIGNAAGAAPGKPPEFVTYPSLACTLFNEPGKGLNLAAVKALPAGVHPIVCIKDTYDLVAEPLAQAAALGIKMSVVHHHEPEADMPAKQFLAESAPFAKACAGWDNVSFGIKLLRFSQLQKGADFRQWIPPGVDWVGLDAYDQTGTVEAEDLAEIAVAMSEFAQVPGALTEFMWLRSASDTTGAVRAARITKAVVTSRKAQFRFAMPWVGLGSKTKQYPLGIPFGPFPTSSPEYGATLALITNQ